jgi:hypothetical protein
MSNYKAITGSSKIVHRNQGGGSKLQGIPSTTNLNTWAHVAFRNRNVVCACNRDVIFCMNQLGGVGAGGIPGRSYAFAPGADGTHKQFYCGHRFGYHLGNNKHLIYPKKDSDGFTTIAKHPNKINFLIYFKDGLIRSDNKNISNGTNGTIYKLKGANIEETIFRVDGLSATHPHHYTIKILGQNSNILSYKYIPRDPKHDDPLFELLVKN